MNARWQYEHLKALRRYAESDVCRRVPLLAYFGEKYSTENCGMCDICRKSEQNQVDLTIPAQKFLSCVKRTGERFGAVHIVDVLLGSQNQKVLKFGHQELSTYGIGKDLSRKQWLHVCRQLVQKGLLDQGDRYSGLRVTPRQYRYCREQANSWAFWNLRAPLKPRLIKLGGLDTTRCCLKSCVRSARSWRMLRMSRHT